MTYSHLSIISNEDIATIALQRLECGEVGGGNDFDANYFGSEGQENSAVCSLRARCELLEQLVEALRS